MIKLFKKKKSDFLSWDKYESRIRFIEVFHWQQETRRISIKNSPEIGA